MTKIEELVKRLRLRINIGGGLDDCVYAELRNPDGLEAAAALKAQAARISALEAQVKAFWEAAEPWANAATRIDYFDGKTYDAPLYALRDAGASLRELCNGIDGPPLRVSDLRKTKDDIMLALQMTENKDD